LNSFLDALKKKVLIFDGAMGTSIHTYDLTLDDYGGRENCPEILVETRPDVISEIHESFFKVGCDVVETDTFGGSPVVLVEFDLAERAYELNLKAAQLARTVANDYSTPDQPRFVSGSIGPTTKLPSLGHISFADMSNAYYQQVSGLVDGGVDCLQFETGQDLLQAKATHSYYRSGHDRGAASWNHARRNRYKCCTDYSRGFSDRCYRVELRYRSAGDVRSSRIPVPEQSEDGIGFTKRWAS
jgi:methionine synthase I (cobalamin-dependent)